MIQALYISKFKHLFIKNEDILKTFYNFKYFNYFMNDKSMVTSMAMVTSSYFLNLIYSGRRSLLAMPLLVIGILSL